MFELDPRLTQDCIVIGELKLSRLLLMNDRQYPWLILVPRVNQIAEMYELSSDDQQQLWSEIAEVSRILKQLFEPYKINIGALGNVVRQLHVHVIARYEQDIAWPGPVWGAHPALPYKVSEIERIKNKLQQALSALI